MDTTKKIVLTAYAGTQINQDKRIIILERQLEGSDRIQGKILVDGQTWETTELPYLQNQKNISSIPKGIYTWQKIKRTSNNKNALYLRDVDNRTEILIHQGTLPKHSQGCILVPDYETLHRTLNNKGLIIIL